MRLLRLMLAMALVSSISFPVHAELLKNFKTDGSIEVKSFAIDNESDRLSATDDYRGETLTRLMVGGSFDLLDDVHARILIRKNNRLYGGTAGTGSPEDLNTVQSNLIAENAYVKIDKLFNRVDLTLGRQFYGRSDDLVIYFGPNPDDILSVASLDIARADADLMGYANLTGIAGKLSDAGGNANSDSDLFGAEVNTEKLIPKGNLAAYYYTAKVKGAGATGNNTLNVFGLRATGDILMGLGYDVELAANGGRDHSAAGQPGYDGDAYLLKLKYGANLSEMPLRAHVEYGRGTNDFMSISSGKRFGKIWGEHTNAGPSQVGALDGTGLQNLRVFDAGVGIDPIKKLSVDVNAYRFTKVDALQTPGAPLRSLGTEYDLILGWKHSDNVTLEVSAATLQVGDALWNATNSSPVVRLGSDVKIKF